MNDNNDPQGGNEVLEEEDESTPKPLLDNPSVTIYFDGLIYSAFNEAKRLYQTAVLTKAEKHHLNVEVRFKGEKELLFPTEQLPWNPDHEAIKGLAPFWLYVDSGNGLNPEEFSSSLHLPENEDEQSFAHVFNFNEAHGQPLVPIPETFAEFNFPQGTGYSAKNKKANLKFLAPNQEIKDKGNVKVSTLIGLDIDAVSNGENKKFIVLANQAGQEFFRFELKPGKPYEIQLLNQPIPQQHGPETPEQPQPEPQPQPHPGHGEHGGNGGHVHINHAEHFLQFYELFGLDEDDERFIVDLGPLPPDLPHSPPCVGTGGDKVGGLGGS